MDYRTFQISADYKIAMMYADTGGGHRSATEAIAQGLGLAWPGQFRISTHNTFKDWHFPFSIAEDIYPPMVNQARGFYSACFHATNTHKRIGLLRNLLMPLCEQDARDFIQAHPADMYLSCHPLYNQLMPKVLADLQHPALFVNVVTDLVTGHAYHYNPAVDACIVPTEYACQQAIQNKIAPQKVFLAGQPIWPNFARRTQNSQQVKRELGLSDNAPMILLMGGGDGMGTIDQIALHIMNSRILAALNAYLVVVCGRNQQLKTKLEQAPSLLKKHILGFVNTVPELMGAASVLVSKAGPGTICEAFVAGLPVILYDAIPGQEEGNVDYVVQNGAGVWSPDPIEVVHHLATWLSTPSLYAQFCQAELKLAKPDSAIAIANILVQLAQQPRKTPPQRRSFLTGKSFVKPLQTPLASRFRANGLINIMRSVR